MNFNPSPQSSLYKGLALFTPGGDLVYCLDPLKQGQWHLHLCAELQNLLALPELPLFLTPCYTATVDRWLDPQTQNLRISAEAYPPVLRHQAILNVIFDTEDTPWQPVRYPEETCDPLMLQAHRQRFPQLWHSHDLVVRLERNHLTRPPQDELPLPELTSPQTQAYVLRLFVTGYSPTTERTLKTLHWLLDESLQRPYTLKIVDVTKQPEQAEADHVSATPTLVKAWPHPVRRLVGDLDNIDKILRLLSPLDA